MNDTLASYKKSNNMMKRNVARAKKIKESAEKETYKSQKIIERTKEELDEAKSIYEANKKKYSKYKENLAMKDKWIIKQGDEISKLRRHIDAMRRSMNEYKQTVEQSKPAQLP